ncbi:MAG TPA: trypsin-like peptidase domain-containing protein [Conexibacter sp.]|nr:trypsin-like peptidase domain-containing protein [Conexibacter sp.]
MPRARSIRRAVLIAVFAALAATLAACGGGSSGSNSATGAMTADGGGSSALDLQRTMVQVIGKVSPSVVNIETSQGQGSGIVFDTRSDIVTNAHVVAGETRFRVTTASGHNSTGTLLGTFAREDLAVVRAPGVDVAPASFGRSAQLQVGDIVLAIGNPLGLHSSVTDGIVSALGRDVQESSGIVLPDAIQTSAPINPGNSGGALVDLAGRVVGIPTLAATSPRLGGQAVGIGFAIPSDTADHIARQLIEHGRATGATTTAAPAAITG